MTHPLIERRCDVRLALEMYRGAPLDSQVFKGHTYVFDPNVGPYYVLRLSWGKIERNSFLPEQVGYINDRAFTVTFGDEGQYQRTYTALPETFQP